MKRAALLVCALIVTLALVSCVTYTDSDRLRKSDFAAFEGWYKINSEPLMGTGGGQLQGRHLAEGGIREVYVNHIGRPAFEGEPIVPLPVGTILVKDTYYIASDGSRGRRWNITVMRKREAGYDPEHSDWEYVTAGPKKGVRYQGKMDLCIDCHVNAERDYVFTW